MSNTRNLAHTVRPVFAIDLLHWIRLVQDILLVNCTRLDDEHALERLRINPDRGPTSGTVVISHILARVALSRPGAVRACEMAELLQSQMGDFMPVRLETAYLVSGNDGVDTSIGSGELPAWNTVADGLESVNMSRCFSGTRSFQTYDRYSIAFILVGDISANAASFGHFVGVFGLLCWSGEDWLVYFKLPSSAKLRSTHSLRAMKKVTTTY